MLFGFEQALLKSPRYIPMFVRMKLALAASFLSPSQWEELSPREKAEILALPGVNVEDHETFAARVQGVSTAHPDPDLGTPKFLEAEQWSAPGHADPVVQSRLETEKRPVLSAQEWDDLSPLQRFALMTLARETALQEYLGPALQEFQIGA